MTRDDTTERLARIYSSQAPAYADIWSPIIRTAGRRLLEQLPWEGARRIVDIGTGAGAHLPDVRRLAPAGWVLGVDRSDGMLALARAHGTPLALMDAMDLALRDQAVDLALMIFMLFHLEDPLGALRGVRRVLRPGGVLGAVTWAEDPDVEASRLWEAELDTLGAREAAPIPRQHDLMNSPDKMAGLLAAAGLTPLRVWIEPLEHTWKIDTLFALHTGFGRAKRKLDSLEAGRRRPFLDRMRERLASLPSDAFVYRATAVCSVACRSA